MFCQVTLAAAGRADLIVTGDKAMQELPVRAGSCSGWRQQEPTVRPR